jgi:hypothetical protein
MEHEKRRMFHGAMDALLDAGMAAESYSRAFSGDTGVDLLICYGFLQAIYIQQDAVRTLSKALDLEWRPRDNEQLAKIRDARNRLSGHPSRNRSDLSSAIIPYQDISRSGFRGHVYCTDEVQDIDVDVSLFLKENESNLTTQMLLIEETMDRQEREFRKGHRDRSFTARLEGGFSYLLQRLHCNLSDETRVVQSETHASMIKSVLRSLQQEVEDCGFGTLDISYSIERLLTGINLLENILNKKTASFESQYQLDIVYDGIEKDIVDLKNTLGDLDARLNTSISDPA